MAKNLYEQVPYRTFPRRQTHPERLAAVGRLFGISAAPVTRCRVLEIGCGSGGNILSLAYTLPHSSFVGIDLARKPIAAARITAKALRLANVDLRVQDLRDLTADDGPFDYILAHGIYSWVPQDVRDKLLGLCRALLAPNGIAFVSYNAYPGSYERQMLREMLLYRGDTVAGARRFLRTVRHEEAAALADSPDDILFHDILAPHYHPVYFHQFTAHARQHKLRYLGDADPHEMFDESGRLMDEAGEQELDFRKVRRFRQTLLCRASPERKATPKQMDPFLFSKNRHGKRVPGDDVAVEAVAQALEDMHPLPVAFEELVPYAGSRASAREILFSLVVSGCADLHTHDFPCEVSVTDHPRASSLARYQAETGSLVTNLCHVPVHLNESERRLLLSLDGKRKPKRTERLEWLAQMALLER